MMLIHLLVMSELSTFFLCVGSRIHLPTVDDGQSLNYLLLSDYGAFAGHERFIKFSVDGNKDAHLKLMSDKNILRSPLYWIIIGGWNNYKSVLHNHKTIDEYSYHGLLVQNSYKDFWISWTGGNIRVGTGTTINSNVILELKNDCPFAIKNIEISTMHSGIVYWVFQTPDAIIYSPPEIKTPFVDSKFKKMENCPTFEVISSKNTKMVGMCGLLCLKSEYCSGFKILQESGLCELVSDTALNNNTVTNIYKLEN